jgi:hypothetical protein
LRSTEPNPVEVLLRWLSARGSVGRATLEQACSAIAKRFEPECFARRYRGPYWRRKYAGPLVRMGHVEGTSAEGVVVVPPTLLWRADERGDFGRGTFYGARDERLLGDLEDCLGPNFRREDSSGLRAATWVVDGDRADVTAKLNTVRPGLEILDEPGERLLAALPTLEQAIAALREVHEPASAVGMQVLTDPSSRSSGGAWKNLARGDLVSNGLIRREKKGCGPWMIMRDGVARALRTSEERAVAWWAELSRIRGAHLTLHASGSQLELPASRLPLPVLVDRALSWADGHPPDFNRSDLRRGYHSIARVRAQSAARVLGMMLEEVP